MKSIIIVHTEVNDLIYETIKSVKRFTKPPYEIIIFSSSPIHVSNDNNLKIIDGEAIFNFSQVLTQASEKAKGEVLIFIKSGIIVTEGYFDNLVKNLNTGAFIAAPLFNSEYLPQNYKKYVDIPEEIILQYGPGIFIEENRNEYIIKRFADPACFTLRKTLLDKVISESEDYCKYNILFFKTLELCNKDGGQVRICLDSIVIDVQPDAPELTFYGDFPKYLKISEKEYPDFSPEEFFGKNIFFKNRTRKFSIVILTYNKLEFTKICIDSIFKYTDLSNGEIIVIDNNSTDQTVNYLSRIKEIKLIKNRENRGFPAAVNQGILESSGDFIFIVNNDIVVTEGWMDSILDKFDENPRIAAVGPRTNYIAGYQMDMKSSYSNEKEMFTYARERARENKGRFTFVRYLKGFCFAVKKDVIDKIGGLDERFGIGNFEDDDFSHRILKNGYLLAVAEDVFVHHYGSVSFGENKKWYQEILSENGEIYRQKWGFLPEEEFFEDVIKNIKNPVNLDDGTNELISRLLNYANNLTQENRLYDAINLYRYILKLNPRQPETIHNLSLICYRTGHIPEAKQGLNLVLNIAPGFAEAHNSAGLILLYEEKHEDALREFKKAIYNDINFEDAYKNYEFAAEKTGKVIIDEADIVFYTSGIPFDGNTIHEKGLGGSESAMYYMAKEFANMGLKVKIFNNCENPGVYDGVEYHDLTEFYIYKKFNRINVFISSRSFKPFFIGIEADVKVIWLHDRFNVQYLEGLNFSELDFSDIKIFTLSQFQTEEWKNELNLESDNFYVTRNGIVRDFFKGKIKRKKGKLIYSSRPSRGLKILLDIFPEIKKRVPEAELHVFTYALSEKDNELAPLLEKIKQPGVIMRGSVSQKQLAVEMMESELLVYPSIFKETSCITAIEAQASGTPVITTALAALKETVVHKQTGILLEGDAFSNEYKKEYIDTVVEYLKNRKKWENLSKNGRERALTKYTWSAIAKEWLDEFEDIKKTANPKLSLCMIVKDEEKNLPVVLDSVKNIVDEIIVVDTGSKDNTKKVAEKYGAKIYDFKWMDDFSKARNESIKYATGEWILYLDADEKIDQKNAEKIRRIIRKKNIDAVNLIETIPQKEGGLFKKVTTDYCRLFRNKPEYEFRGKVHEQILDSILADNGKVEKSDIEIIHWGFNVDEKKAAERKERNLNLLLEEYKKNPEDPFVHMNLGLTYKAKNDFARAKNHLHRSLELSGKDFKKELSAIIYVNLSQIYFSESKLEEAKKFSYKVLKNFPDELLPHYILAGINFEEGKYEEAIGNLKNVEKFAAEEKKRIYAGGVDISDVYLDMGNSYYRLNDYANAESYYKKASDLNKNNHEIFFNLGNAFLLQRKLEKAENSYLDCLKIKKDFQPAKENLEKCRSLMSKMN